ncbi:hypothetical protein [uncultured Celeribacter sp.]|uniref:hypothetical protein n=1 Tax=uncultured Celeribacter sp. TaxID=1303376 RepID=UPI002AA6293A|nr:hypothetical protein [uncultured Celeribacter sp.]
MAREPLFYRMSVVFQNAQSAQVQADVAKDRDLPGQARDNATALYVDLLEKMHADLCAMIADGSRAEVLERLS